MTVAEVQDLAAYIATNASKIPVRAKKDGKWGSFFLTELSAQQAIDEAMRFIIEAHVPVVLKESPDEKVVT